MNAVSWTMVGLAGGFVVLALYGKYRNIKEQFLQARAEEEARARAQREHEPPIPP
jgi:hypothetical protein